MNLLFFSLFHFEHNIAKQTMRANESAVSANTSIATGLIHTLTQLMSYHKALSLPQKIKALVIVVPLWVLIIFHRPYLIKTIAIKLILMSTIMTIHSFWIASKTKS